ncbi:gas vesicle synthesis family protein [Natrialba hulunbeirensis JCM 10989]|uniref:Gas vesicle synthesis family protein n=1 Tax=Natrialba hulunbeirensis JCM 10989 TaxID=1227493 RepID=M0A8F0_9EURY|nr:gas vesicle protein [Natrialba hulunbeirensis]ELY95025.1 gas vesicle synthesis family protein [Natrialba hulunbeirensis JCM 10989]
MANAETADATTQCKALTADGERCSRPAREDGFCFQHDEDDPTVSESDDETDESSDESEEQDAEEENGDGEEQGQAEDQDGDGEEQEQDEEQDQAQSDADHSETDQTDEETHMASDETTDPGDVDTDDFDIEVESDIDSDQIEGVLAIRRTVVSTAGELIGHEFDGVSEISPTDEGWCAVVEVVERSSIPDTQDVLGRYEIDLDTDGVVQGYRRLDRYRRGDTTAFE